MYTFFIKKGVEMVEVTIFVLQYLEVLSEEIYHLPSYYEIKALPRGRRSARSIFSEPKETLTKLYGQFSIK